MIDRRSLLAGAGSALAAPSIASAQAGRRPRVAVLDWSGPSSERVAEFVTALAALGYIDGATIVADVRHAQGDAERADRLASEIVAARPDVVVTFATPAGAAIKRKTATIPVIAATADPVGAGLVTNVQQPEGNFTGVSSMLVEVGSKQVEILRELVPALGSIAYIGSKPDPATPRFVADGQAAAERSGIRFMPVLISKPTELEDAFAQIAASKVSAAIIQPLFALNHRSAERSARFASDHRVPAITGFAYFPRAGGLAAYGPDPNFGAKVAARYVERILKGAKVSELPVEQPTKFELVVNLKTAKSLGLTIPPSILVRADEVIE